MLAGLDPALSGDLALALRLFEYGPILFDFTPSRFSRLEAGGRDAAIRSWMTSRIGARRLGFTALRNLAMVGYYAQEETWGAIGYEGPLLRSPAASPGSALR